MAQEATHLTTGSLKSPETPDGKLVRPNDITTVYATDKNTFTGAGEAMDVHPELAAKLIAKGMATDKAPAKKDK